MAQTAWLAALVRPSATVSYKMPSARTLACLPAMVRSQRPLTVAVESPVSDPVADPGVVPSADDAAAATDDEEA